jgi:hypothetical protein
MLKIIIPGTEFYNERKEEFVYTKPTALTLEHSLLSLSKWESKWRKPFLGSDNKTIDECIDYVRCMTQEDGIDPLIYQNLSEALFKQINDYIEAPMTATTIRETFGRKGSRQIITNELSYYWKTALAIPFECEKWHLHRVLMLIRVCNEKNAPQKKMSKRDIYSQNRALNAARKSKLGTHG